MADKPLPEENGGHWFRAHVEQGLRHLEQNIKDLKETQERLHIDNVKRADDVAVALNEIKLELTTLKPVKAVVYGFISLTMVAVIMGLLALVLRRQG